MRDNYDKFTGAGTKIVAVSQDDAEDVNEYWSENSIPFVCLPDPDSKLKKRYNQQSGLAPLPALFIIDKNGTIRLAHYGTGMKDIPTIEELLKIVHSLP
jgi:peroxiredoxin